MLVFYLTQGLSLCISMVIKPVVNLRLIYIGEMYCKNVYENTCRSGSVVLALATLGDATLIGLVVLCSFVSHKVA